MKYIKTYEKVKYLKLGEDKGNKFKQGDIVFLTSDYINGTPKPGISKIPFKIGDIDEHGIFFYQLYYYLDEDFLAWIPEINLRLAEPFEIDALKYNL